MSLPGNSQSRRFPAALLCFLLWADPLAAQGNGGDGRKFGGGRVAWIVAAAIPEGLANPIEIKAGDETTKVTLSKRSMGEPVAIPEGGLIRMVGEIPNPEDPDKPFRGTLAQTRIPEAIHSALVILIPLQEPTDQRLFEMKVQDLAEFRGGDTLYLNISPRNIQVESKWEKIELGTGDMRIAAVPRPVSIESIPVTYSFMDPRKGTWSSLGTSMLVVQPTRREICFFTWDAHLGRIDYHGMTFPVAE